MSEVSVIAETTYWKAVEDSDAVYTGREEILEVMRDPNSGIIEFAISPDAQAKTVDRLYIRVPAQVLMAALTNVMLGKEPEV
jgi:hypothetical protein